MISLHVITMNRDVDILRLIDTVTPYVDKIRVCDGGSHDSTKDICKAYGVEYYYRKWDENYAAQDNFLLSKASRDEWILLQDDDEIPSLPLLENLKCLIKGGHNRVRIPALDCLDDVLAEAVDVYIQRTDSGVDRFRKDWLFKNIEGTKFYGTPHRGFVNGGWIDIKTSFPYIHVKTTDSYIVNDCIHAFINPQGQGYTEEEANKLLSLCHANRVQRSRDVLPRLQIGDLPQDFIQWIISYADEDRPISRWFWAYFYMYHPSRLFKYTDHAYWLEKQAMRQFLSFKRGFGGGNILTMHLHPVLKQMIYDRGVRNIQDLGIN